MDIDDELLRQAMKALGAHTKTDAVHQSLLETVRLAAGRQLVALGGKIPAVGVPAPRRRAALRTR